VGPLVQTERNPQREGAEALKVVQAEAVNLEVMQALTARAVEGHQVVAMVNLLARWERIAEYGVQEQLQRQVWSGVARLQVQEADILGCQAGQAGHTSECEI
jgi:hypothetical protein